eukprot:s468_g11.t1
MAWPGQRFLVPFDGEESYDWLAEQPRIHHPDVQQLSPEDRAREHRRPGQHLLRKKSFSSKCSKDELEICVNLETPKEASRLQQQLSQMQSGMGGMQELLLEQFMEKDYGDDLLLLTATEPGGAVVGLIFWRYLRSSHDEFWHHVMVDPSADEQLALSPARPPPDAWVLIELLCTDDQFRGRGVGKLLLVAALAYSAVKESDWLGLPTDRRLALVLDAMAFSSNAAPIGWSFPDVPEQAATVATVSTIQGCFNQIQHESLAAILAIEEHGAEMSPAAWQQVRSARTILRLVQDVLLRLNEAGDHPQQEPLEYFRDIRKWSWDAVKAHREGEHTEVTRLAWSILARTRAAEQWHEDRNTVPTQLVALGAPNEEGSERSTQTAMTRSGMPTEPAEKTDEEVTDGSGSVGEMEVEVEPEAAGDQDAQTSPVGDAEGQESLQAEPDGDRDDRGQTSLHLAAENGSAEVGQLLVANPGAIHAQTKRGRTPLHAAAAHGQVPTLQLLLASDAVVNAADVLGTTALHLAVTHGSTEAVEVLLDHHADLRSADLFGQQPLHYAAGHGLAAVVQVLLARGADAAARDALNRMAYDLAKENLFEEVAELLS